MFRSHDRARTARRAAGARRRALLRHPTRSASVVERPSSSRNDAQACSDIRCARAKAPILLTFRAARARLSAGARARRHRPMKLEIPSFTGASVLVIGDVMLDRYWYGTAGRVSPEAPVPIVDVNAVDEKPGGAANVAINIAALGARCTLVGVVGRDDAADTIERKLSAAGVTCDLIRVDGWPTIVKLRVVAKKQQLLRADFERPFPSSAGGSAVLRELERRVKKHLPNGGVVVLEDYDKGTLDDPGTLIAAAKAARCRVVVDPKFKPVSAYRGADVLKPNGIEFDRATGGFKDFGELVHNATQLARDAAIGALVVTRGADGLTVIDQNGAHRHVPARAVDVFDETGAGDTVAAMLGAGLAAGLDVYASAALANLAAGLVVEKSGTAFVTAPELERALHGASRIDRGVMTIDELGAAVADAHRAGERVVFTNGCFDVLHAGHVAYLEEARALGDRLIVAVNDDASVSRLKGPGRPVNSLDHRARVLAGLSSVDWVVPFAADTPLALLERIKPDMLVKGGDYALDQVVGADLVRGYGGTVKVLSKIGELSTTRIVEALKHGSR